MCKLSVQPLVVMSIAALACGSLGCQAQGRPPDSASSKVPITTTSDEARELFLQGRDLFEKLRVTDAHEYYRKAVEDDPNFALAHLAMANTSPTANEFWRSLEAAVKASDAASSAERHFILAAEAAANADPRAQLEHLDKLVEEFPDDERVRNAIGAYYFGRQEWQAAVEQYEAATRINSQFSQPYNQLGYALRFAGRYDDAERAFKKYIELIPDEPNPYDSYAELLMKLGRYEESIDNYRRALERDPNFIASYVGIGNNEVFMGQGDAARKTFAKLGQVARNSGERRQALLWTADSYIHEGKTDKAVEILGKRYAIAEEEKDHPALAGDLVLIGTVLLEAGRPKVALAKFEAGIEMMDKSDAPQQNKDNFRRTHIYREARVALATGDVKAARERTTAYGERIEGRGAPFEVRLHNELLGRIALKEGNNAAALEHLAQANQQDPRVLLLVAMALQGKGDKSAAREMCERAANFNGVNFNYAFVRGPALEMLSDG